MPLEKNCAVCANGSNGVCGWADRNAGADGSSNLKETRDTAEVQSNSCAGMHACINKEKDSDWTLRRLLPSITNDD